MRNLMKSAEFGELCSACRNKTLQHYVPAWGEALAEVIVDRYASAAEFRAHTLDEDALLP